MPSWSDRPLPPIPPISTSGSAPNPSHPSPGTGPEGGSRRQLRPRDAPNMPSVTGSVPRSPNHRGHNRSISNPFAGFGRKRDKTAVKYENWDSDDDDDDVFYPVEPESSSPRKGAGRGGHSSDLAQGKCQTCDATVRWPQHLKVFRCSDCLMVTDLEPDSHESKDTGHNGKPSQGSQCQPKSPSKGITTNTPVHDTRGVY
jgi:E3 ubiquitin-protein ligase HECTD2